MRVSAPRWGAVLGAALVFVTSAFVASAQVARDPPYPPGLDPGGIAVAVFADAVDYTDPKVAARLARDGEGDVIGWDFTDNDARPYGETDPRLRQLLAMTSSLRVIVGRAAAADQARAARLTSFAVRTPARVVLVWDIAPARPDWALFLEGVRRFPDRLFVIPCADPVDALKEARALPNLIAAGRAPACDVVLEDEAKLAGAPEQVAASYAVAMAADLLAAKPSLTAREVKQELIALCGSGCRVGGRQPR